MFWMRPGVRIDEHEAPIGRLKKREMVRKWGNPLVCPFDLFVGQNGQLGEDKNRRTKIFYKRKRKKKRYRKKYCPSVPIKLLIMNHTSSV